MSKKHLPRLDELEESRLRIWQPQMPYSDRQILIGWAEGLQDYVESGVFAAPASWVLFRPSEAVANVLMRLSVNYTHLVKQITDSKDFCEHLYERCECEKGEAEDLAGEMYTLGRRVLEAVKTIEFAERDARFHARLAKPILKAIYGLTVAGRRGANGGKARIRFPNAPGFLIAAEIAYEGTIEEITDAMRELCAEYVKVVPLENIYEYAKCYYRPDGKVITFDEFRSKLGSVFKCSVGESVLWYHLDNAKLGNVRNEFVEHGFYREAYRLTARGLNSLDSDPDIHAQASGVTHQDMMRNAMAEIRNGKTAKSSVLIKRAGINRQQGLKALRILEMAGEYDGFVKPKSGRYRPGNH